MEKFLMYLLVGIAGVLVGSWLGRKRVKSKMASSAVECVNKQASAEKEQHKEDIISFVRQQGKITNADVEKLCGVSDATATRYLQALEDEGVLSQHGGASKDTYYTML
jgi:Fic family protein